MKGSNGSGKGRVGRGGKETGRGRYPELLQIIGGCHLPEPAKGPTSSSPMSFLNPILVAIGAIGQNPVESNGRSRKAQLY